jgi:hypothetical protein
MMMVTKKTKIAMAADINLIMAGSLHAGCNIYKGNDLAQIVRSATFLKK